MEMESQATMSEVHHEDVDYCAWLGCWTCGHRELWFMDEIGEAVCCNDACSDFGQPIPCHPPVAIEFMPVVFQAPFPGVLISGVIE